MHDDTLHGEHEGRPWQQLGEQLAISRQRQGLALDDVQQITKIWSHQLEALERGDVDRLPSLSWARGLTITYANSLGLEGESLAEEYFPLSPTALPHRRPLTAPLRRHWKELLATVLGAGFATVIIFATAVLLPYNPVTGGLNDFLHRIAPGTFMASGPQVVAAFADTQVGASGEGNVMVIKVARDGVGVLSIPRNTVVEIPDHGRRAFGDALKLGGPDLARRTTARLTDVEVPYYFATSAEQMKGLVDDMGGVRIDVPASISGRAALGGPTLTLDPGPQTLNGDQALVFLQGPDLTSDVERAERQQAFMSTMVGQVLGPRDLLSDPENLNVVLANSRTNLSGPEAIQIAARLRTLKESDEPVAAGTLPGREISSSAADPQGTAPDGHWVPDVRKLPKVLEETLR